jgi:SulP family sulfate permease
MGVLADISFAAFVFTGELESYLSIGVGIALFGAIVARLTAVTFSSFPTLTADVDSLSTTIVAISLATITSQLIGGNPDTLLSTVLVTIALTATLTGLFLLTLGQLKVGSLVRFVPYPVIGGFLAGTGWLLFQGSLKIMTEHQGPISQWVQWFQPQYLMFWAPGFAFALIVLGLSRRYQHWSIMPASMAIAITLFYTALWGTHTPIEAAIAQGWLLQPFPQGIIWNPLFLHLESLGQADWGAIGGQLIDILTVAIISPITILLNASALELMSKSDLDFNQELNTAGLMNGLVGLTGGFTSFHVLTDSSLVYRAGARSRWIGLVTAGVFALVLFQGATVVSLFPKFVLGGLLLFFAFSFLLESLYDDWAKLTKADYVIVWIILLVIGAVGFLQGVGVGLLFAVVLFVINYSQIDVTKHASCGAHCQSRVQRPATQEDYLREQGEQIYILELQGLIFFGTAYNLLQQIRDRLAQTTLQPLQFCILDFRQVKGLDSSAVLSFAKLKQTAEQAQIHLVLTHLSAKAEQKLQRGQILSSSHESDSPLSSFPQDSAYCHGFPDLDRGLEWCENQILEQSNLQQAWFLPLDVQFQKLRLNPQQTASFVGYLQKIRLAEGDFLFRQGDEPKAIYFVESGQLSTFVDFGNGKTRRIRTLNPGTMLGEIAFNAQSSYQASAIADQATTLYSITHAQLSRMEQENPEIAAKFSKFINRQLAQRLNFALQEIDDLLI